MSEQKKDEYVNVFYLTLGSDVPQKARIKIATKAKCADGAKHACGLLPSSPQQ
jgi:hypothetical protein